MAKKPSRLVRRCGVEFSQDMILYVNAHGHVCGLPRAAPHGQKPVPVLVRKTGVTIRPGRVYFLNVNGHIASLRWKRAERWMREVAAEAASQPAQPAVR